MPDIHTSFVVFPRISREVLKATLLEIGKRDNVQSAVQFHIAQPYVFEFVVQDSCGVDEAAMRLSAMELFCRALQLQMGQGV